VWVLVIVRDDVVVVKEDRISSQTVEVSITTWVLVGVIFGCGVGGVDMEMLRRKKEIRGGVWRYWRKEEIIICVHSAYADCTRLVLPPHRVWPTE
jgi:hypothetical protein